MASRFSSEAAEDAKVAKAAAVAAAERRQTTLAALSTNVKEVLRNATINPVVRATVENVISFGFAGT